MKSLGASRCQRARAAELLVKIARTVQFAHEHGILHRDIKPGNILFDSHGEPHLTDFGLARLIEHESTVTNSFDVLGTPSYMAPEQAAGNARELTAATDVYASWRGLLSNAHRPAAFCRRNDLRNDSTGLGNRAAEPAALESESGSRSCHDLLEVPREGSKAALRNRRSAGARMSNAGCVMNRFGRDAPVSSCVAVNGFDVIQGSPP